MPICVYIYIRVCVFVLVAQLCPTLCNPKGACQAPLSMHPGSIPGLGLSPGGGRATHASILA